MEINDLAAERSEEIASGTDDECGKDSDKLEHGASVYHDGRALINVFCSFLVVSATEDLLPHALMATLHIEGVGNVVGALRTTRKAKSIVK